MPCPSTPPQRHSDPSPPNPPHTPPVHPSLDCPTAELQRYYAAAAEAAQEVVENDDTTESNADMQAVASDGAKPLDSPR